MTPSAATVTIADDDVAGFTFTPITGHTKEDGHGDLHGRSQHAAVGGRDDPAGQFQHGGRHGLAAQPGLHERELEHAQTVTVTGVNDTVTTATGLPDRPGPTSSGDPTTTARRRRSWRSSTTTTSRR
jgi:hypothetical protein